VARVRDRRSVYRVLVGETCDGMRQIGRPMRRLEDNIKMDLRKIWGSEDWTELLWLGKVTGGGHL